VEIAQELSKAKDLASFIAVLDAAGLMHFSKNDEYVQMIANAQGAIDKINLVPDKYRGLDRFEARKQVVADITAAGLAVTTLVKELDEETGSEHLRLEPVVEPKKIMQPFGDRSKVVIEPMLTDQWFVDTVKIVEPALEAVRTGATRIIPESGEKTYYHWLESIEPWCISRQIWWGHRIPVWYGPTKESLEGFKIGKMLVSRTMFCAENEAAVRAKAIAYYGDGYEVDFEDTDYKRWIIKDGNVLGAYLHRDPDVLDTWFSSGLWPIGTLGWPDNTPELQRYFPTSVLVTGQDILFFWVARMMMMQLAVVKEIPFHTVYLHGLVRDAKGKKMSKSLGNVIDPLEIIDEYGADALRFANAAMASLGGVLKLDTQRIAGYRNFGTKLWNACRFAEMNGVWEGHATGPAPTPTATVNKWIMGEAAKTLAEVNAALTDYRFDMAADALYKFVWGKVCDWYVEFAKPLFDGPQAAETRQTMAWVLDQCMVLLHPFMPFITEELWATTGQRAKMLVQTDWPSLPATLINTAADVEMTWVTTLIDDIRSARAQMHVPVGLKLHMVHTGMTPEASGYWQRNETLIQRLARVESLVQADTTPKGAITVPAEGATFAIPLAGIIDVAEEKARLSKAMEKLNKEIAGLNGRLKNPNFAASAPEDVVAEAQANLDARQGEAAQLQAALNRLAEIG
jgi:valyl-tRNA synthetase